MKVKTLLVGSWDRITKREKEAVKEIIAKLNLTNLLTKSSVTKG